MAKINIALEIFGITVTILLLFCCIIEVPASKKQNSLFIAMLVCNIAVLSCDAMTWIIEDKPQLTPLMYGLNFFVFSLGYVLTAIFTWYLVTFISSKSHINKWISPVIDILCGIAILLVVVSMYNHMYFNFEGGDYNRGAMYWLSQVYPIGILLFDMLVILKYSKSLGIHDTLSFLSYGIIPAIAMIIQIFTFGITLLYLATTLSLIIIYVMIHVEQNRRFEKQSAELTEANVSIMLSQIQPHFLYNSLTVVKNLCRTDPELAENVVISFSNYLRGNLDSISAKKPVRFVQELEHTRNFLELEKLQYGDRLNVIYDIRVDSFLIPTLTLQPIAENSVKYGLKKKNNITVIISSYEDLRNYYITVEDDGVGFDINETLDTTKSHIGINNVRNRLKIQVKSTLNIESTIGVGTKATITIPKDGVGV